jgi:hypothetical protein
MSFRDCAIAVAMVLVAASVAGCSAAEHRHSLKGHALTAPSVPWAKEHDPLEQRVAVGPAARVVIQTATKVPKALGPLGRLACRYRRNCATRCIDLLPKTRLINIRRAVAVVKQGNSESFREGIEELLTQYASIPLPSGFRRTPAEHRVLREEIVFRARVYWLATGPSQRDIRDDLMKRVATVCNCTW